MRNSRGGGRWKRSGRDRTGPGGATRARTGHRAGQGNPRDQARPQRRQTATELTVRLTEEQCGISQYISSTPGFNGIIKYR